jgi:hypothetical protein
MNTRDYHILSGGLQKKYNTNNNNKKNPSASFWADRTIVIIRKHNEIIPPKYMDSNFNVT